MSSRDPEVEMKAPGPSSGEEKREGAQPEIDLHALAEKVYQLLKKEMRIERERLGRKVM